MCLMLFHNGVLLILCGLRSTVMMLPIRKGVGFGAIEVVVRNLNGDVLKIVAEKVRALSVYHLELAIMLRELEIDIEESG